MVLVGLRHCDTLLEYRVPNPDFIQCPITKRVKENGDILTKQCIHDDGINHTGGCQWFKFVKKKW